MRNDGTAERETAERDLKNKKKTSKYISQNKGHAYIFFILRGQSRARLSSSF